MQRKSFLKFAVRASWSWNMPAQTSFQLAPKNWWAELISQFLICNLNSSKNFTLRTKFTSQIAKSTSPRLSDTTFFARCLNTLSHYSHTVKIQRGFQMLLDSVTIFCSTTETTIMKYNVFPCIWTFYYCLQYHCMVKGYVTHQVHCWVICVSM